MLPTLFHHLFSGSQFDALTRDASYRVLLSLITSILSQTQYFYKQNRKFNLFFSSLKPGIWMGLQW